MSAANKYTTTAITTIQYQRSPLIHANPAAITPHSAPVSIVPLARAKAWSLDIGFSSSMPLHVPMITAPVAGGWVVLQLARIMCAADCGAHNQQAAYRIVSPFDCGESCLRCERVVLRLAPCAFTSFPLVEPAWFNVSSRPWCPRPWPRGAFCTAPVQKFWAHFSLTLNWGFDTVGLRTNRTKSNQSLN